MSMEITKHDRPMISVGGDSRWGVISGRSLRLTTNVRGENVAVEPAEHVCFF